MSLAELAAVDDKQVEGEKPVEGEQKPVEGSQDPASSDPQAEWFYDENLKGEGNRPEWLKEKYKTIADQAKAYSEAEKRLGAHKGAPDDYNLELTDFPDVKLNKEADPLLQEFLEDAKKNNVSQDFVTNMLGTYVKALTANIPDPKKEMERLGVNGERDVKILAQWGSSSLDKDEYQTFLKMMTTAESVRVLDKIRNLATGSEIADPTGSSKQVDTEAQVRQMIHDPRFESDPTFRADVERRLALARKG